MRVLFVGDIHNHNYMFQDIQKLDEKYNFKKIIFMGDYVDDWDTSNIQSLETLDRIFTLKDLAPDKFVFLIGNHELSYLGFKCSGHKYELDYLVEQKLKENIDKLDFYYRIELGRDEYICSHAGFTNGFVVTELEGKNWKQRLGNMNQFKLMNLYPLSKCSYLRGGRDEFSSFLWCDRREHNYLKVPDPIILNQIVGHTPVQTITKENNIYFIDTHSTYRDGTEYGDKSYLMWDNNEFKIVYGNEKE